MTKRRKARELALQFLYEEDGNINDLDYKSVSHKTFRSKIIIKTIYFIV